MVSTRNRSKERTASAEEERQRQIEKNQAAIALLKSWLEDDDEETVEEQRETWAYLQRVLDEDRPSYRKLFP